MNLAAEVRFRGAFSSGRFVQGDHRQLGQANERRRID
jgi:hypothetical protein